jgi:hypothetical protein
VSVPAALGVKGWLPLVANDPFQLPDAVQLFALTEAQVIVVELPRTMEFMDKVRVGAGGGAATIKLTVLVADVPTAFVHVSEYVSVPPAEGVRVWLPLVASVPLQLPEAVQLAAFADDQVIVDDWPRDMEFVLSISVGAAGTTSVKFTDAVAEAPAAFVQLSV